MAFQMKERAEQFVDSAIRVRAVRGLEADSGESEGLGWPDHPAFGALSRRAWGVLIYRHMDHHLRQFGA